jgi:hypothetical protein
LAFERKAIFENRFFHFIGSRVAVAGLRILGRLFLVRSFWGVNRQGNQVFHVVPGNWIRFVTSSPYPEEAEEQVYELGGGERGGAERRAAAL